MTGVLLCYAGMFAWVYIVDILHKALHLHDITCLALFLAGMIDIRYRVTRAGL